VVCYDLLLQALSEPGNCALKQAAKHIALLRGINVSGRNQIRMADLCRLVTEISPALLDRLAGSPVTMRNWRTVLKLNEMTRS